MGMIGYFFDYIIFYLCLLFFIKFFYIICVDEEFYKNFMFIIYDVMVVVDDFMCVRYFFFLYNLQYVGMLKEIVCFDDQLVIVCQVFYEFKVWYIFFMFMVNDLVGFVWIWLLFQKRDLDIIFGELVRGNGESIYGDEWWKGGRDSVWNMVNVRESVNVLFFRLLLRLQ